jgi:iron complex outermembrane receptor protein
VRVLLLDLALFYAEYEDLVTSEPSAPVPPAAPGDNPVVPYEWDNGMNGTTLGAELAVEWVACPVWRLRGTYSTIDVDLDLDPGSKDLSRKAVLSAVPDQQMALSSLWDVWRGFRCDLTGRYVDDLDPVPVDAYTELDARLGWQINARTELSLVGQNLLHDHHQEFAPTLKNALPTEVVRSYYAKVTLAF